MTFSIITPSFRSSHWLKRCIASVADQRGVEVEHIVQDAGSDDGTLDWLLQDARVKAFVEKDCGMYDAINRGLRRSQGEVLAYLNCDEQYLPNALSAVADYLEAHPEVEVLFGDAILVSPASEPISYRRVVLPTAAHTSLVHLNTMSCSMFFRRSILERGHYFDPQWKAIGDAVWLVAMLRAGIKMACSRVPYAAFFFTGENLGSSSGASEEAARWWAKQGATLPYARLWAVFSHRFRKFLSGAYFRKRTDVSIYTPASLNARQTFHDVPLGYAWPRE